jgi:hypothetical protein
MFEYREVNEFVTQFASHEFALAHTAIEINQGDIVLIGDETIVVVGFGNVDGQPHLEFIFSFLDRSGLFAISMFDAIRFFETTTDVEIANEDHRINYYQKRLVANFDCSSLEKSLTLLRGIAIKGRTKSTFVSKFRVNPTMIGYPDWHILFRVNTNNHGIKSLSTIAALVNEMNDRLFLHVHNHRRINNNTDTSTVFYSLCGVGIDPNICSNILRSALDKNP